MSDDLWIYAKRKDGVAVSINSSRVENTWACDDEGQAGVSFSADSFFIVGAGFLPPFMVPWLADTLEGAPHRIIDARRQKILGTPSPDGQPKSAIDRDYVIRCLCAEILRLAGLLDWHVPGPAHVAAAEFLLANLLGDPS